MSTSSPSPQPAPKTPAPPPLLPRSLAVPYVPTGKLLPLWPGNPPGETAPAVEEYSAIQGQYIHGDHLNTYNVWTPQIEVFPAPAANNTGAAVIVCPGGCYEFLSYTMEGAEMAKWLNPLGVSCIVLKYRVPARANSPRGVIPLIDAQRALSLVRSRGAEWGIDPARVGIMGFSAGAHLSAFASNAPARKYAPVDKADEFSCQPDFAILMYAAYLFEEGVLGGEMNVTPATPPTIMIHAADDPYPCESSLAYLAALRRAGVQAELHFYGTGGHGYGLRTTAHPCRTWPANVAEWLKINGWLTPR